MCPCRRPRGNGRIPTPAAPYHENNEDKRLAARHAELPYLINPEFRRRRLSRRGVVHQYDGPVMDLFSTTDRLLSDRSPPQAETRRRSRLLICYSASGRPKTPLLLERRLGRPTRPLAGRRDPSGRQLKGRYWNPAWRSIILGGDDPIWTILPPLRRRVLDIIDPSHISIP
jgi:hypothetical protein